MLNSSDIYYINTITVELVSYQTTLLVNYVTYSDINTYFVLKS